MRDVSSLHATRAPTHLELPDRCLQRQKPARDRLQDVLESCLADQAVQPLAEVCNRHELEAELLHLTEQRHVATVRLQHRDLVIGRRQLHQRVGNVDSEYICVHRKNRRLDGPALQLVAREGDAEVLHSLGLE